MLESIRSEKEQKNAYTAVIGTLGPLLGLVGTVYGMILAFMELAYAEAAPSPKLLSEGISHALVVTLLGVAVSVPAIFFNAFFRNRIIRTSMDTGHIADDLLTQMYHNSKKAGGAGPTGTVTQTASALRVGPNARANRFVAVSYSCGVYRSYGTYSSHKQGGKRRLIVRR